MKGAARLVLRGLLVSLLLAAVFDLPLPASSRERRRLHLVDRSASVSLGAGPGLRLRDADAIVAFDLARAPGEVLRASFAGDVRFESELVEDPEGSAIGAALEAALGRDPSEIVLHSDGRGELGASLLLCRARGVPVHVVPLGPAAVRDIRVLRARAPGDAAPGERFPIEVTLGSTFEVRARVRLGDETLEADLSPDAPATLVFPDRGAGKHLLLIESEDDVPRNNRLEIRVFERGARRRVVAWPGERVPDLKDVDLLRGQPDLTGAHALVVDGPLAPERARAAAAFVRDGGGLLLLADAAIEGPLEDVSPVRDAADQRVAVVFAVDVSGSMKERFDPLLRAVEETRDLLGGDGLIPMAFADDATFMDWRELPRQRPSGATNIVPALRKAKEKLELTPAGRRHILLFTDGHTSERETPEERERAARELGAIGLTVLTVDRELDIARPNVKIGRMDQLAGELERIFSGLKDARREKPGPLKLHPHPVTDRLAPPEPDWLRLTSPTAEAALAATWGQAPAVYPALAFTRAGHGTSGAVLFPADAALLSRALAHVARPNAGAYRLSVEPPLVRARGPAGPPRLRARAGGVDIELLQVRSDLWEGRLPASTAGSVLVELDGAMASAVVPCPPEYERVGLDLPALERIAEATGGRMLRSSAELAALPPPSTPGAPRGGRSAFLWAALLALFVDLAVSTFWKSR